MKNPADDHFHIRPRFKIEINEPPEVVQNEIEKQLKREEICRGSFITGHGTVYLPEQIRHFWSPELNLNIEKTERGTLIRGLYGPRPQVWTMFVLFYSIVGFATMIAGFYGLTLWSLDQDASILWLVPVLLAVFLTLYLVSYSGQKLGKKQFYILHHFIEDSLENFDEKVVS